MELLFKLQYYNFSIKSIQLENLKTILDQNIPSSLFILNRSQNFPYNNGCSVHQIESLKKISNNSIKLGN